MSDSARLEIETLGSRGEGVARLGARTVHVPFAVPGDSVLANVTGERGAIIGIERPSKARVAAICGAFGQCGGCAVQTLAAPQYGAWKEALVSVALERSRIETQVLPIKDAHGAGRRRATLHLRNELGRRLAGFMRARSHEVIDLETCPLFVPALRRSFAIGRAIQRVLSDLSKPVDAVFTATENGLDIDIRGCGPLPDRHARALADLATRDDIARISNHGVILIERRPPQLTIGRAVVVPPPGAFLQATQAGEQALADFVVAAARGSRSIADLFAGIGTFALRLAEGRPVHAVEGDAAATQALARAAHGTEGLRHTTAETRDLFSRPLAGGELGAFDCAVFDPPRAGAEAQARALAMSNVAKVIAISCNPASFARDAAILIAGGYACTQVQPIDQFRHSAHVEVAALFDKKAATKPQRRRLF